MLHKIIRVFLGSERLKFKQAGWHLAACTALWLQTTTITISDIHITISEITDLSFAFFFKGTVWSLAVACSENKDGRGLCTRR